MTAGSKKHWAAVSELLHTKDRGVKFSEADAVKQCHTISEFFCSKISRMKDLIATRLAGIARDSHSHDSPHVGQSLDLLLPVTDDEVMKLISSIPAKSSPMDFLPTSVLKKCKRVFAPLVAHLANKSFTEGCFPSLFKRAQVTPLLKHDGLDNTNPANYRPISNLNTISKLLERLALSRLRPHITNNQNFNKSQSAYRRHHSTETALVSILNDIYGEIDNGRSTLLVALDLSAAFDTVEHSVLLSRLQSSFGVSGHALQWVRSYLAARSQFVRFESATADTTDCPCGVPQGSVLGPLLFVTYVAPVAKIASEFGTAHHQYADDTQFYISLSKFDYNSTTTNLQNCLSAVHTWFSQNGLVINPDKSEAVLFSTAQQTASSSIALSAVDVAGAVVPLSDSVKILGVVLDRHLTFNTHVQNICKSVNYHIRALKHIRTSLTTDMARTVACALVNSRLDYANAVLYNTSASNVAKLQRAQNALARVVSFTRRQDHIHPVLQKLHWLPVRFRIDYKIATLTHKVMNTGCPDYLSQSVHIYTPSRHLRSTNQLLLSKPITRTVISSRAFSQAAPTIWNSLPHHTRIANSFGRFRQSLRTHLYSLAFQ